MSKADVIRCIMDASYREQLMAEKKMSKEDLDKFIESHSCESTPWSVI